VPAFETLDKANPQVLSYGYLPLQFYATKINSLLHFRLNAKSAQRDVRQIIEPTAILSKLSDQNAR
jgi:hypothetical protein